MITVGTPKHEFIRVEKGSPLERVYLRSSIIINNREFYSQVEFPFIANEHEILATLDHAEELLARTVGNKIVKGENP